MPEDHLLEAKSVLQHAGKFYGMHSLPVMATCVAFKFLNECYCCVLQFVLECPRGHPYFVSEVIELK